jgi:putative nucleotidyltransferase with HDIG domain
MMFDFFKRIRLKRQGYSCGRKRRESAAGGWREAMGGSAVVRWLILGAFLVAAALVSSAFPESMMREESGGVFALLALLAAALVHLRTSLRKTWDRNGRVTLVFGALLLQTAAFLVPQLFARMDSAFGEAARLFLGPVALAPMLLTQLLGRRHGLFAAVYGSLWSGLMVPREMALPCVVLGVVTGLTAMATVRHLRKRGQLLRAALITGLASVLTAAALGVIDHPWSDAAPEQAWLIMSMEAGMLMATALVTALVAGGMLPLLESVFGITTPLSWLELADLNHPLLRRMTMEAPGTYHHSLMVANLAEAAAEAVGANGTQCRVCSYFHDIGKLVKPEYCIENITDENPHDDLAPSMSALVVMAHVKDGVDLACRHKLNREITDVIRQHHGTSLVYYFYRKALEQQEAARLAVAAGKATAEDIPEVRESSFRYPGPRPSTRESAIVSLADAVESASRALAKPTPQRIEAMVEEIVRSRLKDGQLDECALTMNDLHAVRESFVKTLRTSLHRRIPYPDEKPEEGKGRTRTGREAEKPATSVSGTAPPPSNVIPMPVTPPVAAPPAQEPGEKAV